MIFKIGIGMNPDYAKRVKINRNVILLSDVIISSKCSMTQDFFQVHGSIGLVPDLLSDDSGLRLIRRNGDALLRIV
jgi:hypothetical protein